MFKTKAKLLYNKRIRRDCFHCALEAPAIARQAIPGQFVNIRLTAPATNRGGSAPPHFTAGRRAFGDTSCGGNCEPLLRRPLSIHGVDGRNIAVLYQVVGPATDILSHKKPGEYLDIIGPLGNGFNYKPAGRRQASGVPLLVAGGMGVAPLVFLAKRLEEATGNKQKTRAGVLIGAKTKTQILCEKEFEKIGCAVKISTDDGTGGFKGRVTDLLKKLLLTVNCQLSTIYACGPRPMLKEISRIAKKYNICAQISLEEHIACGIGACLGCAVETTQGYKRTCKDGPVFRADEIIW